MPEDSPTAAQVAQMMERLNNLVSDMQEIKSMIVTVIGIQRDLAHIDEKVQRLFALSDANTPELARLDKRTSSLERWHKIVGTAVLASLGLVGWGVQRIEYLYRLETRVQILELTTNAQNIERSMEAPKTSGSK